jgi:hypothetical protein
MEIAKFAGIGILRTENNKIHPSTHTSFHELNKPGYHLKNHKFGKFGFGTRWLP